MTSGDLPRSNPASRTRRGAKLAITPWGADLVVGWSAPWGPSLGRIVRGQSGDHDGTSVIPVVLGEPGASQAPPAFATLGQRTACAWIDARGAMLGRLTEPRAVQSALMHFITLDGDRGTEALHVETKSLVSAEASAVALAETNRGRVWMAVATPRGIQGGRVSATLHTQLEPWFEREGGEPRVALGDVRGTPILALIYPGEPELVVVRGGSEGLVHTIHRLDQPVADLAMSAVGSRVALALLDTSGTVVLTTFIDARGKLVEKPVAQIDRYAGDHAIGRIDGIDVTWLDDRYRLVARDAEQGAVYSLPFFGVIGDDVATLSRVPGPPWTRIHRSRLELAGVGYDEDEGLFQLVRSRPDGGEAAPISLRLAPPPSIAEARGVARARAFVRELGRTLGGASYRDSHLATEDVERGARLSLPSEHQSLEVVHLGDRELLLRLTTSGEAEQLEVDDTSFGRLARWARHKLSADARSVAAIEDAWGERLTDALSGRDDVLWSGVRASTATGAILETRRRVLPEVDPTIAWMKAVREELRAGRHRVPNAT